MTSEPTGGEPIPETSEVTQESEQAQDMSQPAPGPQTEDSREFLESEPAYGDSEAPEEAEHEDSGPGLDPLVATDPAAPPRNPKLGADELAPDPDLDR